MKIFSVSKIKAYAYKDLNKHGANQRRHEAGVGTQNEKNKELNQDYL